MNFNKLYLLTIGVFFILQEIASAKSSTENRIATGQGISMPAATSNVNYTDGFTAENPNGVLYQGGGRFSVQYDQNESGNSNNLGAELGYGENKWGMALGYRKNNCNNCEASLAANAALNFSGTGIGLRFADNLYALGILFGVEEGNRFGLVLGLDAGGGAGNKVTHYGLGYSFVGKSFSLTLDASRRQYEDNTQNSNVSIVTPGLAVNAEPIEISINDRITIDDNAKTTQHDFWFGIGVNKKSWHLVGYSDYVNDIAVVLSFFF